MTAPTTGGALTRLVEKHAQLRHHRWYEHLVRGLVITVVLDTANALLPNGLPYGVILLGLVYGSLSALTAFGLVLIYRSARIVNFAQAEMGGVAATVAILLVAASGLPYLVAVPLGLVAAVATGLLVHVTVVRRLSRSPRLVLTVGTVGVAQILGGVQVALPSIAGHLGHLDAFHFPLVRHVQVGPILLSTDHFLVLLVLPVVLIGLTAFLSRSDTGRALRAAADNEERARLLAMPVNRLSLISWAIAAGLSGLAAMLSAPVLGANVGTIAGPGALLPALAAAVVGRFDNLGTTLRAALAIGVLRQGIFWSYPRSSLVDLLLFLTILGALLWQRHGAERSTDTTPGGWTASLPVRPIPAVLARLPEVRAARYGGLALLAAAALLAPLVLPSADLVTATYLCIFAIVAVSLVVLTGWAGQVSLGQFAFAGVGAAVTGYLLVGVGADLLLTLLCAMAAGGVAALLVGLPALRLPGLMLAVTTLAFAVPVSTFLLNSSYFPRLAPSQIPRPLLLSRFDLGSPLSFYFFCLGCFVVAYLLAANLRRSRAGRAVLATRDNERGAAAFSLAPVRVKLTAFTFSGALAGLAGALYVIGLRSVPFSGFDPVLSLQVFTMVVIGGLGSLSGGVLGASYVVIVQAELHGAAQLLATGGGLLILLLFLPGGLGEIAIRVRDIGLRRVALRRGVDVPSLWRTAAPTTSDVSATTSAPSAAAPAATLAVQSIDAGYGQVPVLFGVDAQAADGEVVALLGTNGAGKSTVLRVVNGLLKPASGRVFLDGQDITSWSVAERVEAGLVTVPGGRGVFPSLTVQENLRMGGWLRRRDSDLEAAVEDLLELFPRLRDRLGERASSLSGGEQQMLTIAQAILCRPRILLIDELSLGLAPSVVGDLLMVVRQLAASGTTVVVVEQSLSIATSLASRAYFMERGQVRFDGPTADLEDRPDLIRAVFLGTEATSRAVPMLPRQRAEARDALTVSRATRSYGATVAVDDVSFTVSEGEIVGIIGSNGAGKTTLFDLVSGFVSPSSGGIQLFGQDVTQLPAHDRAAAGLGRLFQDARLFPGLTVGETLAVALERYIDVRDPVACMLRLAALRDSEAAVSSRVEELVHRLGLDGYRDSFVAELSTGTRRVVELGCAIAHRPSVLLLDEPASGIAQRESEALAQSILRLRDETGATLLVIDHDIPLLESVSDRLICMHLGRVIADGAPRDVLGDPAVIASYLGGDEVAVRRSGARPRQADQQRPRTAVP